MKKYSQRLAVALILMMVSTVAQAEPVVELYHTNRLFTAIEFNQQGNLTADQLEGEAGRITDIVKGEPIGIFIQVGLEKETTVALGYDSGSNAWQAAVESSDYVSPQGHWDKTFDNVGWTVGTKSAGTNWTAYIWSLQNGIYLYSSWTVLWPDENGMFMITNVMVGSLGDYPPMTEVWDIGPDLSPAHSDYPGDNQSIEKIYKADLTAYYQVALAGIMITPEKAGAPVGGEAVAFTASGLTQYGVEWMMYPDGGPDGAWLEPAGSVAYVWPGNVPGIYQIYAWSSAYPQFNAGAELDVIVVEINIGEKRVMPAKTTWPGSPPALTDANTHDITIYTQPAGFEELISLAISEVTPDDPPTGDGNLTQDASNKSIWHYESFLEAKTEKHPVLKGVDFEAQFNGQECATEHISVANVFQYLSFAAYANDKENAWRYAKWKYDINTDNLSAIAYDSSLPLVAKTSCSLLNVRTCSLGFSAFSSENVCASTLGHENVHGGHPYLYFTAGFYLEHWTNPLGPKDYYVLTELPAYQWELDNASLTGLADYEIQAIIDTIQRINNGQEP